LKRSQGGRKAERPKQPRKRPPLWRRKAVRARVKGVRRRWKHTGRAVRRAYNRRYRFT